MIKSILTALVVIASLSAMAQDLDELRDAAGKKQWVKAKDGIEKYLSNEKNAKKGSGWFLKAQIYNGIARDSAVASQFPNAREEAFTAYKKYLEVDPKGNEGIINQHSPLFDIAFGYQEQATMDFNTKKFEGAMDNFQKAENVENYIVDKGFSYGSFSFPAYDTQLYLNIAASAINAKRDEVAVKYYQKIADKKIKEENYDEIYRYLVDYFDRKGDVPNRDKYLAIGKEMYPKDDYWCEVGLQAVEDDKKKLFAKYEELLASGCDNYVTRYNYSVEMYNYADVADPAPQDKAAVQKKLEEVLKKALQQNKEGLEAQMLMNRHFFSMIKDLDDQYEAIKGTKPDDIKKKNEITAQINKVYEDAYPSMMAAFDLLVARSKAGDLKASEKGQYKIVTNMLTEYWTSKKNKDKVKEFDDKSKAFD